MKLPSELSQIHDGFEDALKWAHENEDTLEIIAGVMAAIIALCLLRVLFLGVMRLYECVADVFSCMWCLCNCICKTLTCQCCDEEEFEQKDFP